MEKVVLNFRAWSLLTLIAVLPNNASAAVILGSAADFAVMAGSAVTNTGSSVIEGGHVGVDLGSSVTGFPPGIVTPPFSVHIGDSLFLQAKNDLSSAYLAAQAQSPTQILTGLDLGGLTLSPGVYFYASSAQLTGTLILDFQNDPNAQFIFQIGSTLTTASASSVQVINGGTDGNVFWQVGSSATLGTTTSFKGHILALTSITLTTGATIDEGSALAINGAVTLDSNHIVNGAVPEPESLMIFLVIGGLSILCHARQKLSCASGCVWRCPSFNTWMRGRGLQRPSQGTLASSIENLAS
jgi:hypothetical protein